jgi:hypothetical protein
MTSLPIGYLLSAGTTGFVAGCSVSQVDAPVFGALVKAPLGIDQGVYGLIHNIAISDDGLVRQLVTAGNVTAEVMQDNRERRIVPVEISVLAVGFENGDRISHLLPPRPPLSLDRIYLCPPADLVRFTAAGRFGYFRHLLQAEDIPTGELLAAHLQQARHAHQQAGSLEWFDAAARELITLLRDDYPTLMSVLGALGDASVN